MLKLLKNGFSETASGHFVESALLRKKAIF
jgi:hypothetical protein